MASGTPQEGNVRPLSWGGYRYGSEYNENDDG